MNTKPLTEQEKAAVCTRYVQTGSLRAVAAEFGISPMRVKRLWQASGEDTRTTCRETVAQMRENVCERMAAVELSGDYLDRVIEARAAAITELHARLMDTAKRREISDKNLIAACKVLHEISATTRQPPEQSVLFLSLNDQVNQQINQFYIYHEQTSNDSDCGAESFRTESDSTGR